jgi:hypothetical protein
MQAVLILSLIGFMSVSDKSKKTKQPLVGPRCAETIVIMLSGAQWDVDDIRQMKVSKQRCIEKFKNSPCLKTYTKVGTDSDVRFRMICGGEKK